MRLVLTLLVRDERDVIRANVAYHLSLGVDAVVVTDNGSVDGTRDVLADLAREAPVTVIDEPAQDYAQSAWVTRMARLAAEDGADWVVNADADEFWTPLEGGLPDALARVDPDAGGVVCPRVNMRSLRGATGSFAERMRFRDELSHHAQGARIGSKVAHRAAPDVVVAMGNHAVESAHLGPVSAQELIEVLHFPHRSLEHMTQAVRNGAESLMANPALGPEAGWHWRRLYEQLQSGELGAVYDRTLLSAAELEVGASQGLFREDRRVRDRLETLGLLQDG